MIQKIKNIDTQVSEDQIEIEWSELFATKNRLLSISDWTQLPDVYLTNDSKKEWQLWRQRLRKFNRSKLPTIEHARKLISDLKKSMPTAAILDESKFTDNIASVDPNTNVKKEIIITKEQPIIYKQTLEESEFLELFKSALEKNPLLLKHRVAPYLSPIDSIEECKEKCKNYLYDQQKNVIDLKLKQHSNLNILHQRSEEALEYLIHAEPNIEDFPLIKLHSENTNTPPREVAMSFLREKKSCNHILLEAEKFLFYNSKKIDEADSKDQLNDIIEDIKKWILT